MNAKTTTTDEPTKLELKDAASHIAYFRAVQPR
jgi:hypothetical protein